MDSEKQLAEKIKVISELAKVDKNIDVTTLISNALENQDKKLVSAKQKRWAYLVSIGLPPFGLLFALKYFYGEYDDGRHVALVCVILTVFSVIALLIMTYVMFSTAGVNPQQIMQLKPQDVQQLME